MKYRKVSKASYLSYELVVCLSQSVGHSHVNMSVTRNPLIQFSPGQYLELFTFFRTAALTYLGWDQQDHLPVPPRNFDKCRSPRTF